MNAVLRKCTAEDTAVLRDISRRTFAETFADSNSPEELNAFLDSAYDEEKLRLELLNKNSRFYFAYFDGTLAGYMKLNEVPAQSAINDADSLEVERLYILRGFQRLGLGGHMLSAAIEKAHRLGKRYVWLGVWEHNEKAKAFYAKYGFYRIGEHPFFVGSDKQTDYILRRDL